MHVFGGGTSFFSSRLVMWTVIYFFIAYMKFYGEDLWNSKKLNIAMIITGLIGNYGMIYVTNLLCLKGRLMDGALQIWNVPYNPFILVLVIGMFNITRNIKRYNDMINYLSKLSLFVYLIHENRLLRTLYRPAIWQEVYLRFGYAHVLCWDFILAAAVFLVSLVLSILYFESLHKLTVSTSKIIYNRAARSWNELEERLFRIP